MKHQAVTATDIAAPSDRVWRRLANLKSYQAWNSRTHFDKDPRVGRIQLMRVKLFGLWLPVPVRIQYCSAKEGLRWIGGIPLLYTGSHYFKLSPTPRHTTLTQGEDFQGLLVPLLWPFIQKELYGLYEDFNRDLRELCENTARGED